MFRCKLLQGFSDFLPWCHWPLPARLKIETLTWRLTDGPGGTCTTRSY